MGSALPGPTQFLVDMSRFVQNNILYILGFMVLAVFIFRRYYKTEGGRLRVDRTVLKLPVFGMLLKKVAVAIQRSINRPTDFVARYGGEEFVVVLSNTNREGAIKIAEDIRNNIKILRIHHSTSQKSKYVSLSLGISTTVPISSGDKDKLIKKADQALYKAKQKGRNQIFYSDENS